MHVMDGRSIECTPTEEHAEGPYYRPDAPETTDLYPSGSTGKVLWFTGTIRDSTCRPVTDALMEVWQADDSGRYDNDDPEQPPPPDYYRCRARMRCDEHGRFGFRTVWPSNYTVPGDGGFTRVKHIHFKVFAARYQPLTTEITLLPDDYTQEDPLYDPRLAIQPVPRASTAANLQKPEYEVEYDFVLRPISAHGYTTALRGFESRLTRMTRPGV